MMALEIVGSRPSSALSSYSRNSSSIGNYSERDNSYLHNPLSKTYDLQKISTLKNNRSNIWSSSKTPFNKKSNENKNVIGNKSDFQQVNFNNSQKKCIESSKGNIFLKNKDIHSYRPKSNCSNVDETLFSSNRESPFQYNNNTFNRNSKNPNYDQTFCKSNDVMPTKLSYKNSDKAKLSTRPNSAKKNQKKFSSSFVDESLFGNKIEQPNFPAPWEDISPKQRPQFCDQSCVTMDKSNGDKRKTYEALSKNRIPWK